MIISEPSQAYPLENYSITEHDIDNPDDYDGDGIDDITEFNNMPIDSPFNYASPIDIIDGSTSIPDADTFMQLATVNNVGWAPFLDDQLYVKFGILDRDTPEPKVYFINSNTYTIHANFWNGIGASVTGDTAWCLYRAAVEQDDVRPHLLSFQLQRVVQKIYHLSQYFFLVI